MFEKIRRKIGKYYFIKDRSKINQVHGMINLPSAKRIGILYTLDDVPDYDKVSEFVSQLQLEHKEVKALDLLKAKT